jgi:hypothetical protein
MVHIKKHVNNVTTVKRDEQANDATRTELKGNKSTQHDALLYGTERVRSPTSLSPDELNETRKIRTKRAILEFFSRDRVKPNSIKVPSCPNVSRGILLAIIFVVLFTSIIIWFLFTDASDEDLILNEKQKTSRHSKHNKFLYFDLNKSNVTNISELYRNEMSVEYQDHLFVEKSQKVVVFVSTVSIVICIIIFVFVSAIVHYFRSPIRADWSEETSFRRNMFSSIFSYNRNLNNLYLLDQAIARDEVVKSRNLADKENGTEVNGTDDTSRFPNEATLNKGIPIIVVEEVK